MGIDTKIEWCDSTVNAEMGCDGCELWSPKTGEGTCYAATLTERYGGRAGWPESFGQPKIFPERIAAACQWSDLAGTVRPDKPWLDGRPRMIFLDDMGDTFTESLPLDWLAPEVPRMAASPHIWMVLTKRPRRMRRFFEGLGAVPPNVWAMTSVTGPANVSRVAELGRIEGAAVRMVSYEPILEAVDVAAMIEAGRLDGVIFGGESGPEARPCDVTVVRAGIAACRETGVAAFVKQLGGRPTGKINDPGEPDLWWPAPVRLGWADSIGRYEASLRDPKGGNPSEWPEDLRVRELPAGVAHGQLTLGGTA